MKRTTQLSAAVLCVLCACGGQSSSNVSSTDPSNDSNDAIRNARPFTINDFKSAAAMHPDVVKTPSQLTESTVITLSNGYSTTLGDYINQLNQLETGFNKKGMSLRSQVPGRVRLNKTEVTLVTDTNQSVKPSTVSPSYEQFTPMVWQKSLGDPSKIGLALNATVDANSGPDLITTSVETDVTAFIMGQALPLVAFTSEATLPVPLAALDRRYSMTGWGMLGGITPAGYYAAPNFNSNSTSSFDKQIKAAQVTFPFTIGPIPIEATLSISGDVGVTSGATTEERVGTAYIGPSVAAKLNASAVATVKIVSVGVEGSADLIRFTPSLKSEVDVTENGTQPTSLTWSYGFGAEVSALKGEINVVATVDLWILGKRQYTWTILTSPGVAFQVAPINLYHSLERPALSPMPSVAAHVDTKPFLGAVGAGDQTFGGACPAGTVRSQCRAYPEQDDDGDCSNARFVNASPTDCTCTFHVGASAGNPVKCGADIWVTPAG